MFSLLFPWGIICCCKGTKYGSFVFKVSRKCLTKLMMLNCYVASSSKGFRVFFSVRVSFSKAIVSKMQIRTEFLSYLMCNKNLCNNFLKEGSATII